MTNNRNTFELYDWMTESCFVVLYSGRLEICQLQSLRPELVVSYNYKYRINEEVIRYMAGNILNLHISYLPWNRGVAPNIWSFIDDTPKGVTIHQVDAGFDRGKILFRKQFFFNPERETFASTYRKLNQMLTELFKEKWDEICNHTYTLVEQKGEGSSHSKKDFDLLRDKTGINWDENVADYLRRINKIVWR